MVCGPHRGSSHRSPGAGRAPTSSEVSTTMSAPARNSCSRSLSSRSASSRVPSSCSGCGRREDSNRRTSTSSEASRNRIPTLACVSRNAWVTSTRLENSGPPARRRPRPVAGHLGAVAAGRSWTATAREADCRPRTNRHLPTHEPRCYGPPGHARDNQNLELGCSWRPPTGHLPQSPRRSSH